MPEPISSERSKPAASASAAEHLAQLHQHLLPAGLAEVDAPLGVVAVGGDVVVARVDVADVLVGAWSLHAARHSTVSALMETAYVQSNQPDGVPPLALTGERTLPDVPEENYWYRRHLVVYEWIARAHDRQTRRRHGVRRGLRLRGALARARRPSSASTRTPRRTSTRGCATCARTCASSATSSRRSPRSATRSSSCRRSSTCRTRARSSSTSSRCSRPAGSRTSRRRTC